MHEVTSFSCTRTSPLRLFCRKPWLALMPNWVCSKEYFYSSLQVRPGHSTSASSSSPFYIAPRKRYNYWTPRGRREDITTGGAKSKTHGHTNAALGVRTSPFVSFWYCGGIGAKIRKQILPPDGCLLCWSVDNLPPAVKDCK